MKKKYELINGYGSRRSLVSGKFIPIYQIKALRDFGSVKSGEFGGWVESESNLSHGGDCWIYNGVVVGKSILSENAIIDGPIQIYGSSVIRGSAILSCKKFVSMKDINLNHGHWNNVICIKTKNIIGNWFMFSNTLEKLPIECIT